MLADADNRSRAALPAVCSPLKSDELSELLSPGALQKRLEQALRSGRSRQVTVGLLFRGQIVSAAVSDPVDPARSADALKLIRTGCLTKLFTYALVLQAVTQGILRLDHDAGELLEPSWPLAATRLRGISVANLLEHTHGLDDSGLRDAPLLEDGRIDLARLIDQAISDSPLCAPGTLYSYSHIGPLLLAAILEQRYGQAYHALLSGRLFAPLAMEHRLVPDPKPVARTWRLSFSSSQRRATGFASSGMENRSGGMWTSLHEAPAMASELLERLEQVVIRHASETLGIGSEFVCSDSRFGEIGFDSMSLLELSRRLAARLSPYHFIRIFRAVFRNVPYQVALAARLDRARTCYGTATCP